MKKIFILLVAICATSGLWANENKMKESNIPSDSVLLTYASAEENVVVAIHVSDSIVCNDIIYAGPYNQWSTSVETCKKFVHVEGYAEWYVVCVQDSTSGQRNIGKPVQLNQVGVFNWDFQIGTDAEIVRGDAYLSSGYSGEIDIIGSDEQPLLVQVNSWKNNPCTVEYRNYSITLISSNCDTNLVPVVTGGFNSWDAKVMTKDEQATEERAQQGLLGIVYRAEAYAAEGTQFKFRSYEGWTNVPEEYFSISNRWVEYNYGKNLTFSSDTVLLFDMSDSYRYSWTSCEKPVMSRITYVADSKLAEDTIPYSPTVYIKAFDAPIVFHVFEDSLGVITFAGDLTTIGEAAFANCSTMTSITLPNSVTSIEGMAFNHCTQLQSCVLPNSLLQIGSYAFSCCYDLNAIAIPDSTTYIGACAFEDCYVLSSVSLGSSVATIEERAFSSCHSLASFEVAANNKHFSSLDGVLFNYAQDTLVQYPNGNTRTTYTIPNTVICITDGAMGNAYALTQITLPSSLTTIGKAAFFRCYSLTSFIVDEENTHFSTIDGVLFDYDQKTIVMYPIGLTDTSYQIPSSVTAIGTYAFANSVLKKMEIPNTVTSIEFGAFTFSGLMTSITIPNSVTSIGNSAFAQCTALPSLSIPSSVTSLGQNAFFDCTNLANITCEAATPPVCGAYCFSGTDTTIPLYVPSGSISAYQTADEWKDFTNIQAITAQEVEVTEIESKPTSTTVVIAWPAVTGSDSYTIEVKQGATVICIIVFNAQGQLLSINFNTAAPSRGGRTYATMAEETATGWAYQIKGLTPGTAYTYSVVAKDKGGTDIDTKNGSFQTSNPATAIEQVDENRQKSKVESQKYIIDGHLYILREGVIYNANGQIIR